MKRFLALALGLGLVFAVAGTASAISPVDYGPGYNAGGIADSRHNLSHYGKHFRANNFDGNGGTTEICLFCHTPHHGTAKGVSAPLWNKGAQTTSYTAYGSTIGSDGVSDTDIGGATLACLSCHDGVNTIDTIVNRAGKDTISGDPNWTFTEDGNTVLDVMLSGRLNIGTDLTNDHPVSIAYTENVASLRASSTNISSLKMVNEEITVGDDDDSNSTAFVTNRWAVKGYVNTDATIANLLRDGKVECSSCHDPHFSNKSWDETEWTWGGESDSDGTFLRRVGGNSLSGVCLTCHDK